MNEILYVSDTFKESKKFLQELADELSEMGVAFKIDWRQFNLETDCYKMVCKPINSGCLGCGYPNVKYFANCVILHGDLARKRIMLKEDVSEIKSREQILSLLIGGD